MKMKYIYTISLTRIQTFYLIFSKTAFLSRFGGLKTPARRLICLAKETADQN